LGPGRLPELVPCPYGVRAQTESGARHQQALAGRVRPFGQTGVLDFVDAEGALGIVDGDRDRRLVGGDQTALVALTGHVELDQQVVEALVVPGGEEWTLRTRRLDLESVGSRERVEPIEFEPVDLGSSGDVLAGDGRLVEPVDAKQDPLRSPRATDGHLPHLVAERREHLGRCPRQIHSSSALRNENGWDRGPTRKRYGALSTRDSSLSAGLTANAGSGSGWLRRILEVP